MMTKEGKKTRCKKGFGYRMVIVRNCLITLVGLLMSVGLASCKETSLSKSKEIPSEESSITIPFNRGIGYWPIDYSKSFQDHIFPRLKEGAEIVVVQIEDWYQSEEKGVKEKQQVRDDWLERAEKAGLIKYIAIEPFNGDRSALRIPSNWKGSPPTLANSQWNTAFRDYVLKIVGKHKPQYLNIAVEANMYYQHHPEDYDNFRDMFNVLYKQIKQISPDTKIFCSYQYELLTGQFTGQKQKPQWELLGEKAIEQDMLGISSYPIFLHKAYDPQTISKEYYYPLKGKSKLPIFFAELGFYSSPHVEPRSSPEKQAEFIRRIPSLLEGLNVESVCWVSLHDLPDIPALSGLKKVAPQFFSLGFLDEKLNPKPAWNIWKSMLPEEKEVTQVSLNTMGEIPLESFVGIGTSKLVRQEQGKPLEWSYNIKANQLAMLIKQQPNINKNSNGLILHLRTEQTTHIAIILEEDSGARYEYRMQIYSGPGQTYSVSWRNFTLQDGSKDPNNILDIQQINKIAFLDISGFTGKQGSNCLWIEKIELSGSQRK
ncbi:MAG: hypothetical protein AB1414_03785 [bacterium]